jgi:hypothetical protein
MLAARKSLVVLGVAAVVPALSTACGGKAMPTHQITAKELLTAFRRHGVKVHMVFPISCKSGLNALNPLCDEVQANLKKQHFRAVLEGPITLAGPNTTGPPNTVVYVFYSADDASRMLPFRGESEPINASRTSRRVIGRAFKVSNVLVWEQSLRLVKPVADALNELRASTHS